MSHSPLPGIAAGPDGRAPVPGAIERILCDPVTERAGRSSPRSDEGEVLAALADALAGQPGTIAQRLVEAAMRLTEADSAGLSVVEASAEPEPVFRWVATAGALAPYVNGTMPRHASPCGEVLDRDAALVMREPARCYPSLAELGEPVHEVLLVPFHEEGAPVGTVWAVHHSGAKHFDVEDRRVLGSLSRFAAAAAHTSGLLGALREEDRSKDEFLATLAHELRNPLSPIKVALHVLRRLTGGGDPEQRKCLEVIDRQVGHLSAMIEELMDLSAIRSGKMSLRLQMVSLQDVVAEALEAVQARLEQCQHRLSVDLPSAPVRVRGDRDRLRQVFTNLLDNAAKYTPSGGSVRLTLEARDGRAVVHVRDSGVGIAPDMLGQVFEMFAQAPASGAPRGGLGIGLALVRKVVELHGGGVSASSEGPGRGSDVAVWLPLPHAHASRETPG
jgi:signal transduction histidine kinase